MRTFTSRLHGFVTLSFVLVVSACTSVPRDLGQTEVTQLLGDRGLLLSPSSGAEPATLSNPSLTGKAAISFALVNNAELKALHAELGFSVADLYDAGRISNPVLSIARLKSDEPGSGSQLSLGLVASFVELATLPSRSRMANAEFAAAKEDFAFATLALASDTESAFYRYVAAKQIATLREQTSKAAALSLKMAERYYAAGNLPPKALALEKAAAAEARLESLQAKGERFEARAHLARLLGVSPVGLWDTVATLPLPPEEELVEATLLSLAWASRLDLSAAKIRADYLAEQLGVTNWSRWLGELAVGFERERETDGAVLKGFALEWELPLFSFGKGEMLRVEAELNRQMAELVGLRAEIEHDVLLAVDRMKTSEAQVLVYRDSLIPARVDATRRAQEEENFMLIGVFELIETKQEEYDSYEGYIEAVRDYWLASAELTRAVGHRLPSDDSSAAGRVNIDKFLQPETRREHQMHQMHQLNQKEGEARDPMPHDHHQMMQEKMLDAESDKTTRHQHHQE